MDKELSIHECPKCGVIGKIVASDYWEGTRYEKGDAEYWGWCRLSCGHKAHLDICAYPYRVSVS